MSEITLSVWLATQKTYVIDLDDWTIKKIVNLNMGMDDAYAHTLQFRFIRSNNNPSDVDIDDTDIQVKGSFVRADQKTVNITGTIVLDPAQNKYVARLETAGNCYAVEGPYKYTIYAQSGSAKRTLMIFEGNVIRTKTATTL